MHGAPLLAVCAAAAAFVAPPAVQHARTVHSPLASAASTHLRHRQLHATAATDKATDEATAAAAADDAPPALPTRAALKRFALPALGLWLSSPLLSLVDTSAVGISAPPGRGALQLAALGPATTFCDGAAYLWAFLNVATTNLYATALAKQDRPVDADADAAAAAAPTPEAVVRRSAKIALVCGVASMVLILCFGRQMLGLYIGHAAASDPALLLPATTYIKLRALSLPAALVGGVLQAALLGAKDSAAALIAIGWSTALNLAGDALLVTGLKLGLSGAAVATAVATWASTLVLAATARRKLVSDGSLGLLPKSLFGPRRGGTAAGRSRVSNRAFLAFALPVLTLILGKIAAFGFMTHAAAGLGATSLAVHQIVLTLFFFLSPFLEVVSQTTQSFLPGFATPEGASPARAAEWRATADALAVRLLRTALLVACGAAAVGAAATTFGTRLLTNDAAVRLAARPLAVPLTIAAVLTGPVCASEGVLLARRQLGFLAGTYLATIALFPPFLLAIKRRHAPVALVWYAFAVFQAFRAVLFTGRIWGGRLLPRRRATAGVE